ncbi:MAG: hypothetical protein WCE27_10010 [Pseudolabrys sp.]
MFSSSVDKRGEHLRVTRSEIKAWQLLVNCTGTFEPLDRCSYPHTGGAARLRFSVIRFWACALVLRPIVKPARKSRYTLDELLSGMTRDNIPQEVDWGPRRGNEAW